MGVLQRLGIVTQTRAEPPTSIESLIPSRSDTTPVTVDRALSIPAAFRCVQIMQTSGTQLGINVAKNGSTIPTPALVANPDISTDRKEWISQSIASLALNGNLYYLRQVDNKGTVVNLPVLSPGNMGIRIENGRRLYDHGGDELRAARTYTQDEIIHRRLVTIPGRLKGLGPIQAAREALAGALDLRAYADHWFSGANPKHGILSTDQELFDDQIRQWAASWQKQVDAGGVAVLGKGLKYSPEWLNPEAAQFLEAQKYSVNEVGRLFGVPSGMLNAGIDGNSMTYATLEGLNQSFISGTLVNYLNQIETALTMCLPRGQEVVWDYRDLLKPDTKTLAETDKLLIEAGIMTANEVRAGRGLPPLDTTPGAPA